MLIRQTLLWLFVFIAAALCGECVGQASKQSPSSGQLEGIWTGTLGPGAIGLHLILTISRTNSGEYAGELDSKDQGVILPMDKITLTGDAVRFEVPRVGGVYAGALNKERTQIVGTWKQSGVSPQPLSFTRSAIDSPSKPATGTTAQTPQKPFSAPLDVTVPFSPIPFKADGKWHLVYELHIINFGDSDCAIKSIEFTNFGNPLSISGATLEALAARSPQHKGVTQLGPWTFTIVYAWLTSDRRDEIPPTIQYRIHMKVANYPAELTVEPPATPVDQTPAVLIEPPLRGGEWLSFNGPSSTSVHRRALFPFDGRARSGQRFAVDWVELYPEGKTYKGDARENKNYRAYGAKIHAVADGTVTTVKDGLPENIPDAMSRAITITPETAAGNHVIVDIGNGRYAVFAHLQPGSITVKVGDKVHTGQVLGLLGNSGNSTEPHLHFQICNANSVLSCEGLPYAFPAFEFQGRWKPEQSSHVPTKHEMEMPTEGELLKFPPETANSNN